MKRKLIAAAAIAALFSAAAWAQMEPGMMGSGMMGPGMMGPGMMGSGMMAGFGSYRGIDLSDEQRTKIAEIQKEVSRKQSDLMGKMHEQRLEARKGIDAVLTKEQREQLQSDRHCG